MWRNHGLVDLGAGLGAVFSASVLVWLVLVHRMPPTALGRRLFFLGLVAASGGLMVCWSTIVGHLARTRLWSAQWSYLGAASPFFILATWSFFFGRFAMDVQGYLRMALMISFGSLSGSLGRKKAYPQLPDDRPFASSPPPTLFPK